MDIETRMELIKRVGEEIITEEELRTLLETKTTPIAYEPDLFKLPAIVFLLYTPEITLRE